MPVIVRFFWRHGFSGTNLDQLARELGVTKPTLFRTLGDKESIFIRALEEYYRVHIRPGEDALETAGSLHEALEACFGTSVDRTIDLDNPPGCFLTDSAYSGMFNVGPVADAIGALQQRTLTLLQRRIRDAIDEGELRADADPDAALRYLLSQFAAVSALSRLTTDRDELDTVVGFMIDGLPWAGGDHG